MKGRITEMDSGSVKFHALEAVYSFYDGFVQDFPAACEAGCSACCTVNVTLTTLEADYIIANGKPEKNGILPFLSSEHYRPVMTANRMAMLCLGRKDVPEEDASHGDGKCPLLDCDGHCTIYRYRPFSCRAMSSSSACGDAGEADMHPFLFTVNLAFYQIIEHLDRDGLTGNLLDMLVFSSSAEREKHREMFVTNMPLPGFMIPPDERFRFNSMMRRLARHPMQDGTPLGMLLPEDIV